MFETADRLWLREVEPHLRYHAIEFQWSGFEPRLTCVVRDGREVVDLDLGTVDLVVSESRECVGYFDGDSYIPCSHRASVSRFSQCEDCAGESFIPFQECVFEPKCDGEVCGMEFCSREHLLYLAFYGTNAKIGMSSTRRIERRLIEQGADAFSVIGPFPTRRAAREAEKRMSADLGIPQAFRQEAVLSGFSRAVDTAGIEARHRDLAASFEGRFGCRVEEIHWLEDYPIELPLSRSPRLRSTPGRHRGRLLGIKGKWIIFDSGEVCALNLSDVPSRFVAPFSSVPSPLA
jgi:hypothetical protein